tara:strand:- start:89 stop:1312 length:1224 start_codon:yes stop_codon:yes gene_type:complete
MNILNKINYKNFIITLYFALLIKIILCFLIGDNDLDKEWKIIINNLINHKSFSYYEIDNKKVPSVYMPPLYVYYIYLFYLLGLKNFLTVKIILISQSILSIYSTIILKKILEKFFSKETSIIIPLIFLLFPLNFYSSTQISSVTLQIFLFLLFIFYFINFDLKKNYLFFGVISSLSILIRGEFLMLFMICCFFIMLKYRIFFKICISILIAIIVISPFIYRNYKHFNEFVIVKSSGYNLWRGNNIYADVNGSFSDENLYPEFTENKNKIISTLTENNQIFLYEIKLDDYYKSRAIKNIKEDPLKYIFLYLKKFLYFIFINPESNYPNYFKLVVIVPELILSLLFFVGIYYSKEKKFNTEFFLLITFYFLLIPIFFILPRYKLFILPLMLFYCSYFIEDHLLKLRKNR